MSVPTLNEQSEKWLVGALLADPSLITEARDLNPIDLFDDVMRTIFRTMIAIDSEGHVPTLTGVAQRMESNGTLADVDGGLGLLSLSNDAPYVAHVTEWCEGIQRAAVRRRVRSEALAISLMADDLGVDDETLLERFNNAKELIESGGDGNQSIGISAGELLDNFQVMRPAIIEGTLRVGETKNIIAAPKCGKSWLVLLLAICVACGLKWLGRFWTRRGRVLIIDNELHESTSSSRLATVAAAMGVSRDQYADSLTIWNVRGQLLDLEKLCVRLNRLKPGQYDLIILDAFYRFIPKGFSENDNADMTAMYNMLDAVAGRLGCAFVCVVHTSKGNQSAKSVTDVGAGAGAQSRAADTHMTLRPHEEEGAVVVEAAVRSFAPMEAFCMRMKFPLWELADDLDPKDLRQERPRKAKGSSTESGGSPEDLRQQREQENRQKVLDAYATYPDGETSAVISAAAGMNWKNFMPVYSQLLRKGVINPCQVSKNKRSFPGAKLASPTLRQTAFFESESECRTDGLAHTPTAFLPLGTLSVGVDANPSDGTTGRRTVGESESESNQHPERQYINHELANEHFPVGAA